jgi:hypothetical protein
MLVKHLGMGVLTSPQVLLLDSLFLSADAGGHERQGSNEDQEEVEDGGPLEWRGRAISP